MAIGLQALLKTVVDNKATGLHVRGNSVAYVRMNTKMRAIDDTFLTNDDVKKMALSIMGEREKKLFEQNLSVDFALDAKEYGRFRFNVFRQMGKICMAIRHIPLTIPTYEQLNLPAEILKNVANNRRGIILVTGMTGSGKSSTLAAMIDQINQTRPRERTRFKYESVREGNSVGKSYHRLHRWKYAFTACYGHNEVPLHPWEPRRISVAEALATQSLPADFSLPQTMRISALFKAVGNGVPFLMAQRLADMINTFLVNHNIYGAAQ